MINEIYEHCVVNDLYGFTIPYLYKIEFDADRTKSISEILDFFTKADEKYLISYCDELDEYIIGLPKRESAPINMYSNFGNLHYDQDSLQKFESINTLSEYLTQEYQIRIDKKTYSKNFETKKWE